MHPQELSAAAARVNAYLAITLATQAEHERLQAALNYSTLDGGKRLRPYLIYTIASLYGVETAHVDAIAAAYEMVQAYSLIHDDLPAMDNSPLRRGKPSCWAAFDSATAILTGDALLTYAFEVIATAPYLDKSIRLKLISSLAQAIGANGMIAGQMYDLLPTDHSLKAIENMQLLKTGAFFGACCEAGAIIAGVGSDRPFLKKYGQLVGLIFQITDDLLDIEGTAEAIGKPIEQDAGKQTFVTHLTIGGARDYLQQLQRQAYNLIENLPKVMHLPLQEFLRWVIARQF